MALSLICRRVPLLRDLSVSAIREVAPLNTYKLLTLQWSSTAASGDKSDTASGSNVPSTSEPADGTVTASAPTAPTTDPASTKQPTALDDEDEWTEVVHSSGQLYYWNQRTGETTQLGEPKPESGRGGRGSGGGGRGTGSSAGAGASQGGSWSSQGTTIDPRSEAPLEDRTGTYAAVGLVVGAFLGWVSQFV